MINNKNIESIADMGGHRILGMGGSLMSYIETGNAYSKDYRPNDTPDAFIKNEQRTTKKKENNLKALTLAGMLAASSLAVFNIFKKKKYSIKNINLNSIKEKVKAFNINEFCKNGIEKLKALISKIKIK